MALGIVAALAMRFGYDSRATAYSKEEELARFGMTYTESGSARHRTAEHGVTTQSAEVARSGSCSSQLGCGPRALSDRAAARNAISSNAVDAGIKAPTIAPEACLSSA